MNCFLKRMISFVLVLCMLVLSMPQINVLAADNGPGQYRVSVSTALSLRSGPGTEYQRLELIPNDTSLIVSETSDGWGKTVYNGTEGWISLDYAIYYADNAGNTVSSDQRRDIVRIAQGEVGYKEGSGNYTKYGEWYSSATKNAPWCAIFVSWCAYQSGISESIIPKFSYCATGIQLFKNLGVWHENEGFIPQTGDIIFFRGPSASTISDHVGIVVSCDGNKVYTIEGNSSDAVSERTYKLTDSYIVGYASPKYVPAPTTTTATTTTTAASVSSTDTTATTTQSTAPSSTASSTTAPSSQPDAVTVVTVTGGVVNVRAEAGTGSSKIAAVRRGTSFESLGTAKDSSGNLWYKISVNGKTGYIISSHVSVSVRENSGSDNGTDSQTAGMVVVTGSTVNIRSGAGTDYSRLGRVNEGDMLPFAGSTEVNGVMWYIVSYNGETGYISGDYSKVMTSVSVTGAIVNVRTDAGTQYSRVGSVRRGQTYELTGCKEAEDGVIWYEINWNGQSAFICGTYAKLV